MKSNLPGSSLIFASIFNVSIVLSGSMAVTTRLNAKDNRAVNSTAINYHLRNNKTNKRAIYQTLQYKFRKLRIFLSNR